LKAPGFAGGWLLERDFETDISGQRFAPEEECCVGCGDSVRFRISTIFPLSETTFFLRPIQSQGRASLPTDALVTFDVNETGAVSRIVVQQRGLELPGRKVD
jgi:hypothetical protein